MSQLAHSFLFLFLCYGDAFVPTFRGLPLSNSRGVAGWHPTTASQRAGVVVCMNEVECDVVIIGGGPAGCTCALYCARGDHKTVLLDKSPTAGALAITSHIANYPGVDPGISGEALLDSMREHAVAYGTDYRQAHVFMTECHGDEKVVYTPDTIFKAKVLVLASGALGRPPSFHGEDTYLGQGVSYCATCDGAFYRDSDVVVVGENHEAIEEATFLTKFASTVHWITKHDMSQDSLAKDLLALPNVVQHSPARLMSIEGDASGVTGVKLKAKHSDVIEELAVEGVFVYVAGSKPITDFVGEQVDLKDDGGVVVDDEMKTSVPGVYAIGDIRNTPYKQVVVAASDGCIAALGIDRFLNGRKKPRLDWVHTPPSQDETPMAVQVSDNDEEAVEEAAAAAEVEEVTHTHNHVSKKELAFVE